MKKINKSAEPQELVQWKRRNPDKHLYSDLTHVERQAIQRVNLHDQRGLCAYCCDRITEASSMNEHVQDRQRYKSRQLDFGNIVASCTTSGQCDDAHKAQELPLTPLMDECETELKFYFSGRVKGKTDRARKSIAVLKLDNRALTSKRKHLLDALIFEAGEQPDQLHLLDGALMEILIEDVQATDDAGCLRPFSPVLVNVLKELESA